MTIVHGVVIGRVKDRNDKQHEGQVQVEFPWMPGKNEGFWAPVATPMAGGDRGLWFMPEEGDEVLVAFLHGRVEHPYVVGFLWNGQHQPPEKNHDRRLFKSKKGHTITFDDSDGGERIVITSKSGLTITLDDTPNAEKIQLEGGQRRIVMSQGKVEFS